MLSRGILSLLLFLLAASPAFAEPTEEEKAQALEAIQRGGALFLQAKYSEAIDAYRKAQALVPQAPGPYRELGKCYQELGQPDEAIHYFTEYLKRKPDAEERQAIEKAFKKQRSALPKGGQVLISIDSEPEGALVFAVDAQGRLRGIGATPIEDHPLPPAVSALWFILAPYPDLEQKISLADGPSKVSVILDPARRAAAQAEQPQEEPRGYDLLALSLLGGAAVAGAGTVFQGLEFRAELAAFKRLSVDDPNLAEARADLRVRGLIADGLGVATLALAGAGTWRLIQGKKEKPAAPRPTALLPAPGGLALSGEF